jgi:hypothetical protein
VKLHVHKTLRRLGEKTDSLCAFGLHSRVHRRDRINTGTPPLPNHLFWKAMAVQSI